MRYELWRYHRLLGVFTEKELREFLEINLYLTYDDKYDEDYIEHYKWRIRNAPTVMDTAIPSDLEKYNSIRDILSECEWASVRTKRINDDAFGRN